LRGHDCKLRQQKAKNRLRVGFLIAGWLMALLFQQLIVFNAKSGGEGGI
jgi:hypothetical protein